MAGKQSEKRANNSYYSNSSCLLDDKVQREVGPNDVLTEDDETFDCLYCDRDFRTEKGRTIHMSKAHKKEYSDSQVRAYITFNTKFFFIYFLFLKIKPSQASKLAMPSQASKLAMRNNKVFFYFYQSFCNIINLIIIYSLTSKNIK